jgi:hypothetical protein
MIDLAAPEASRIRRPSWGDPRLLVGLALMFVAVVIGFVVVTEADDRAPVFVVTHVVARGEQIADADVQAVDVHLGRVADSYLAADRNLPADLWALRDLRPGELVPSGAVGNAAMVQVQPMTLPVDAGSAGAVGEGSVVDVYVSRPARGSTPAVPVLEEPDAVLTGVSVVRLSARDAILGSASETRSVTVAVPRGKVKRLVGDVAAGSRIILVPVSGSPGVAP